MKHLKTVIFFLFIVLAACSEKLDFNQAEEFNHSPVFKTSLVYFTLFPNDFMDPVTGTEIVNGISDISDFRILENSYLRDNLQKIIIDIEVKNEITRDFTAVIEFLDDNGTIIYTLSTLNIPAQNLAFTYQEIIDVGLNPIILNTRKTRTSVFISGSSTPLIENDPREFELKSSGTYFIETE
ncbi:hypothetical protein OAC92_01380 [Polaribacter sp.]|nr:hypothetical protein [Polaribacter sp.]MDB9887024.1 hypothetical protein [Polaribacter sp.]